LGALNSSRILSTDYTDFTDKKEEEKEKERTPNTGVSAKATPTQEV